MAGGIGPTVSRGRRCAKTDWIRAKFKKMNAFDATCSNATTTCSKLITQYWSMRKIVEIVEIP